MADHQESSYHRLLIKVLPGAGTTFNLLAQGTAESAQPLASSEIDHAALRATLREGMAAVDLEALGELLFSKIFVGGIYAAYVNHLFDAQRTSRPGVRIVIEIANEASDLYHLPWTAMFDPSAKWWLGGFNAPLHQKTPLSFSVPKYPPLPLVTAHPLRILVVGASPSNLRPLGITQDLATVEAGTREPVRRGDILYNALFSAARRPVTRQRLRERLESWQPHILHFVCHGPETKHNFYSPAGLFLENEEGEADFCKIDVLQDMLQLAGATVRLVVLNVGNSDGAAWSLAQQGIAAIGMALSLSSDATGAFARVLYQSLARGIQLDEAVNRGRAAIRETVTVREGEWILPSLFLPQGRLPGLLIPRPEIDSKLAGVYERCSTDQSTPVTRQEAQPPRAHQHAYEGPDRLIHLIASQPLRAHLQVFLCHASQDKQVVRDLYEMLRTDGFAPWLDEENILPGQDWQKAIARALQKSDVVLVCLSRVSTTKVGYLQKEINDVLDLSDQQPEGAIFIIPLRLDDCQVPSRLARWQWVNYFGNSGYERLRRSLDERLKQIHPGGGGSGV